jgi:amino acid transporter
MGGFTGALMAWIQAVTIGPIEVEAALGYLQSSFPHLGLESSSGTLTGLGIFVAAVCLAGFTYINVLGTAEGRQRARAGPAQPHRGHRGHTAPGVS